VENNARSVNVMTNTFIPELLLLEDSSSPGADVVVVAAVHNILLPSEQHAGLNMVTRSTASASVG
jgi:hypothetical protein